jgi:hypothetical protein
MKRVGVILVSIMLIISVTGCATTTMIKANVDGAKVTMNGGNVGTTPVVLSLSDFDFANYNVTISKDGYKTVTAPLAKEFKVGAFIGGLFVWPFLLWIWGPAPNQNFDLVPN